MPTRPKLSWSDLRGRKVGLWGLGVEGRASLRKLTALGVEPVLVDDDPAETELDGRAVLRTKDEGLAALERCDAVVKTPGISRHRPDVEALSESGVAVVGGLGLWMEEADRERVVVVTGTKGKSTTTAIAAHLVSGLGHRCFLGGNLGALPYDPDQPDGAEFWFIEVSSFQATDLSASPPVIGVTALSPDHLDWHGDVESYYSDKLSACTQPGARLTVADGDCTLLRERRDQLGPEVEWIVDPGPATPGWAEPLGLPGRHNLKNALIARALVVALGVPGAADDEAVTRAARGFVALPSRLETIGTVDGVEFVDDSLATNVLPTVEALAAFGSRRVALIAGGFDRGIDYRPLAAALATRARTVAVFALAPAGDRIAEAIGQRGESEIQVTPCADLTEATKSAFRWARPDGIVLLSPAAPSFGAFRDYRQRAVAFADAMRSLSRGQRRRPSR